MKFLEELEGLCSVKLSMIKNLISLIKLEARLAGLSVFPLLLNLIFLFTLLLTSWLTTMAFVGYGCFLYFNHILYAILAVLLLNIVCGLAFLKYLAWNIKKMSFEKTRAYFTNDENLMYEKLEKTNHSQDQSGGHKLTTTET